MVNVLITGGTSGLGKATVELLAANSDFEVTFTYLATEAFKKIADDLLKKYSNVHAIALNFCESESVETLCRRMNDINPDVLVNCTYVGKPQTTYFHKIPIEDFMTAFKNNLLPTIRITQAAIEVMKKKKFGKIINIITEAVVGLPPMGYAVYAANKAYLMELSNVWNKEYTRYNITSNCILPAYMQTNFADVDERIVEQMEMQHPLKKLLTVEEVAQTILFLIEASQQINGVKLMINGGQQII